jgi:hypothetical protein
MFKKLTAIAILVISIPVAAYAGAWTLNTWARSIGGTISVNGGPTQNVTAGSQFANYTGGEPVSVTITPDPGYSVKYYIDQTGNTSFVLGQVNEVPDGTTGGTFPITSAMHTNAGSLATVWAVFHQATVAVNASVDTNATVNLTNIPNVYPGTVATRDIVFTFTAKPGYVISAVSGVPGFATTTGNLGTSTVYKVTIPKGNTITGGFTLAETSALSSTVETLNGGAAQTAVKGATITLTGTTFGKAATSPNFTLVAPLGLRATTAVNLSGTVFKNQSSIGRATFSAYTTGTFVFSFNDTGATSALTSVQVSHTAPVAVTNLSIGRTCQACHFQNGIGDPTIYARYSSGNTHKNSGHSACTMCHNGTGNGGHPGNVNDQTVDNRTFLIKAANINAGSPPQPGTEGVPSFVATPGAGVVMCEYCHNSASPYGVPAHVSIALVNPTVVNCSTCHTDPYGQGNGTEDAHSIQPLPGCVTCHAVGQKQVNANLVNDNNGVRAITGTAGEFDKSTRNNAMGYRSHHIYNGTGVDPQDAQCIACHLEGSASKRAVSVNTKFHMADGKVHLRDGNSTLTYPESANLHSTTTDGKSSEYLWDPANPNHQLMDQFCMSCHNSQGAVTAYKNMSTALYGMTPITGAVALSAMNPFGDQLTNAYDQKVRPGVVAVYDQLNPSNPSHHGVRAQKYSGRTRTAGSRQIASPLTFANNSGAGSADLHPNAAGVMTSYQVFGTYSASGPASGFGPQFPGPRSTIYDAGLFVANYTTLDGATLGDDSTLHCGDCHSVGQWKAGSANAITWFNNISTSNVNNYSVAPTVAVIGAHGSQNEYMLRTSNGSDSLQTQSSSQSKSTASRVDGNYVCFLCHTQFYYGDNQNVAQTNLTLGTNAVRGDFGHGGGIGPCNGNTYSGYGKKGTARYGVLVNGKATPSMGNVFAMTCAHCHNSGQQNFGGIHGATGTYISYSTNGLDVAGSTKAPNDANKSAFLLNATQKTSYRFMGGESIRYNGGATASKWEAQTMSKPHREGCYNLSQTTDATHLWNTTNPATTAAGGTNAIVNNNNGDSSWGANAANYSVTNTDQGNRYAQNNGSTGWGSCNHHQGSTTTGPTSPTRVIQRPLVY